jgi:hypothetical protein
MQKLAEKDVHAIGRKKMSMESQVRRLELYLPKLKLSIKKNVRKSFAGEKHLEIKKPG